uniref:Uncharacterized protein n=1 Tax=Rhizophora mucronata TaxID=61149 RepID=A0A2P2JNT5_RHIMU
MFCVVSCSGLQSTCNFFFFFILTYLLILTLYNGFFYPASDRCFSEVPRMLVKR